MRIVILGAGGHGQVVADMLFRMQEAGADIEPVGYLDDNTSLIGSKFLTIPVLGKIKALTNISHDAIIIAIGSSQIRQRLFIAMREQGEQFITAQHPTAVIAPDVIIGSGCMICANAVINPGAVIGDNVILNTGCTVDHHNHIGSFAHIAPGVHLGGDVHIGEGALVGIGAVVTPQRSVGAWSRIGAGAVVVKNILDGVTAVGVPARPLQKPTPGSVTEQP